MQNQIKQLYGAEANLEDLASAWEKSKLESKGKTIGIEVELRNPHSHLKLADIIRNVQRLPYIKEPEKVNLKFENKDIIEFNSNPFKLRKLPYVLKEWSILNDFGLTSVHLSYSGKPWEILSKIA